MVDPDPNREIYLGSTVGRIGEVQLKLGAQQPEIICREGFNQHGFSFERTAVRAINAQHLCPAGDNTPAGDLVPQEEARKPLVLFAFL